MVFLTDQHYFDYSKGQNLSQIEHEILAFLLSDSQNEQSCSIRVVAKELTTSTATIIRLCKKLGFSGYTAFTEQLRLEHTKHYPTEVTQLLSSNLIKKSAVFLRHYQDTLDALSFRDITLFTQLLPASHVIQLIGDDSDAFIAYISDKLQSNGFRVLASSSKDTLLSFETKLNETTLILVFNRYSATEHLLRKIAYAKENQVPIIGFLGPQQSVNFRQCFDAQFEIIADHSTYLNNDSYDSAVIMIFDLLMSLTLDSAK